MSRRGALLFVLFCMSCGSSDSTSSKAGTGGAPGSDVCKACSSNANCDSSSRCAILTGESYCLHLCPNGNECAAGEACLTESSVSGEALQVCVPQAECGGPPPPDGGPPPNDAGGGTGGTGGSGGTGGGVAGGGGGTTTPLLFAAVGDTRGALPLTASYPTDVVTQIYTTIEALDPKPPFVVSTGDYAFELMSDTSDQLDLYLSARQKYSGAFYPAMGNHECTWLTTSNCGPGTADGMTPQYTAFLSKLLQPTGQTSPYYTKEIDADDGSWTAKFVFVAPNAWTDAQATWLEAELAKPTTYTFVMRHEPVDAVSAPGVAPSGAIIANYPHTLMIVGHTHTYDHTGQQVMFGNGGAPLTGTKGYGFGLFQRRADGAIQVEARDYKTGAVDTSFTFAVYPDGTPAP